MSITPGVNINGMGQLTRAPGSIQEISHDKRKCYNFISPIELGREVSIKIPAGARRHRGALKQMCVFPDLIPID
jgi:hypothetical protein